MGAEKMAQLRAYYLNGGYLGIMIQLRSHKISVGLEISKDMIYNNIKEQPPTRWKPT
jgi:hypothetical protein